jgi:hypothetical protein
MQNTILHLSQQIQEAVRSRSNSSTGSGSDTSEMSEDMKPPAPVTPQPNRKRPLGPDDTDADKETSDKKLDRAPDAGAK